MARPRSREPESPRAHVLSPVFHSSALVSLSYFLADLCASSDRCWSTRQSLFKLYGRPPFLPSLARCASRGTRGIVALEQGREAWSSFVTSRGSFAVLTATEQAIAFCKALGVEVPDLSGEVKRLVSAW
jgi:hypothetical protein